jgi:hypothetical protein
MNIIELPYFGQIDVIQLQNHYVARTTQNGNMLKIDLNFGKKHINEEQVTKIKFFLDNIHNYDAQHRIFIEEDYINEGDALRYAQEYLYDIEEEALLDILPVIDEVTPIEMQLLKKLQLIRVGLYPDETYGTANYAIFDYTIMEQGEPCNQVLAVKINENGDLVSIDWES